MKKTAIFFKKLAGTSASGFQLLIIYIVMIIVFGITTKEYLTLNNFKLMASSFSILGIVAVGVFFPMLAGVFDLSVSGIVSVTSVLMVYFFNIGLPVPVIVLLALGIGCGVGCINGFLVKIIGINPLISTIGTLSVFTGLGKWISTVIASENIYDKVYLKIGSTIIGRQVPILLLYMVVFYIILAMVLKYTRFGRNIYAVGGNFEIARLAGIKAVRVQFLTYIISGAFAGLAAVLLTSQLASGRPEFGASFTLDAIAVCVLGGLLLGGGKGDLFGLFMAVILLGSISNGLIMLGITYHIRYIVTGSILIISIIVNELRYRKAF